MSEDAYYRFLTDRKTAGDALTMPQINSRRTSRGS
jgi:hypothetical protein